MLSTTPISGTPSKMPRFLGENLDTANKLFIYDSAKPDGDSKVAGTMTLAEFFEGVNALVNAGTISGPRSDVVQALTAVATTGAAIAAASSFVTVTSASADDIIILPAPVVGKTIQLYVGANGYELRSSNPATIAINGGSGAGAESAIAANVLVSITCTTATTWVGYQQTSAGTVSAVQVAAA